MFGSELERRRFAVDLVIQQGVTQEEAAGRVGRSARWLRKWLRRFEEQGVEGLRSLSRAPERQPTRISAVTRAEVLRVRSDLENDEFANRGAEAIRHELWERGWSPLPSISTIERILRAAGVTEPSQRRRRRRRGPSFDDIRQPGVYQQLDWVGPRWVGDGKRFSLINMVDIGGGGAQVDCHRRQLMFNVAEFLSQTAWPHLGIPQASSADNQFGWTSRPNDPWTLWVLVNLLFGVEAILTPPREFGWHNHIESFNNTLQERTLDRHHYPTIDDFTAATHRFLTYWHYHRAHPRLSISVHGTRYPGALLDQTRPNLRHMPAGFDLNDYRDHTNHIRLPIARGRITYLRRVQPGNLINITHHHWPLTTHIPLDGEIVVATILTGSRQLVIRHQGDIITRHPYPIPQPTINPYHEQAPTGLYYHRTGTMS